MKVLEQNEINKKEEESIAYLKNLNINHWSLSNMFAEVLIPMVPGESTIKDHEQQIQRQLSYQAGMFKMLDLLKQKNII